MNQLPAQGLVKLSQLLGCRETNTPPIIPVSRATFYRRIESGDYPKPIKLGQRSVAWRVEDIRELLTKLGGQ
ncbi:MAG: AlpA family phage regulatory protein [Methylococcaceae bacterium]|nr:AlpA family phage regulatory protein [Methylococcaceae bacterium]